MRHINCLKEVPEPGPSSRSGVESPSKSVVSSFWASSRSVEELRKLQMEDPDIGPIVAAKLEGKRPRSQDMVTHSPATRHYWIIWDSLRLQDGILMKKFLKQDGTEEYQQFLVPRSMRREVIYQMHDSLISGNLGFKKTKQKILLRFYWYSLKDDVNLYIQRCDICATDKKPNQSKYLVYQCVAYELEHQVIALLQTA